MSAAAFIPCDGCDGHECVTECQYPKVPCNHWPGQKRCGVCGMDAIKEAMIREEDTGVINPALDPYRERPCTCHPDDLPPNPCPKRFALRECREAAYTQGRVLMLLQSSSCYRGDVCGSLPCACAETFARFAERYVPSAECAHAPDPASRQDSEGSSSIRLGATEIAAALVEAWHREFFVPGYMPDDALGELTRRVATALVGEPR
jgi:hypothetical protein